MQHPHIILILQGPLTVYPAVRVDHIGTTHAFPTLSMMTGLLANALGYDRLDYQPHERLQKRLIFAARVERQAPRLLREYQTAQIHRDQKGWTPTGEPERRTGGEYQTYEIRQDYLQNTSMTVALRLQFPDEKPGLEELEAALTCPYRPLFIGKKHCVPGVPIMTGWQEGDTSLDALREWPLREDADPVALIPVSWSPGEGIPGLEPSRQVRQTDVRNWRTGVHGGERPVMTGTMPREWIRSPEPEEPESEGTESQGTENEGEETE